MKKRDLNQKGSTLSLPASFFCWHFFVTNLRKPLSRIHGPIPFPSVPQPHAVTGQKYGASCYGRKASCPGPQLLPGP